MSRSKAAAGTGRNGEFQNTVLKRFQTLDSVRSEEETVVVSKTNGAESGGSGTNKKRGSSIGVTFMEPPEEWILHTSEDSHQMPECSCQPGDEILEGEENSGQESGKIPNQTRIPQFDFTAPSTFPPRTESSTTTNINLVIGQTQCQHHLNSSTESDITPHSVIFNVLSASPPRNTSIPVLTVEKGPLMTLASRGTTGSEMKSTPAPPPRRYFPAVSPPMLNTLSNLFHIVHM